VCAQYFETEDLDIVLVGNAKQFRDGLKTALPTAKWEEFHSTAWICCGPICKKPQEAAAPEATADSKKRGDEIVKAAAEAAGGSAIQAIDDVQVTTAGTAHGPQGDVAI